MKLFFSISMWCVFACPVFAMQAAPEKSLSKYDFKAASVLPVIQFKTGTYLVLGREAGGIDIGAYDDFGGSRDKGEDHPSMTAAREFFEEGITQDTLEMDEVQVRARIDLSSENHTTKAVLANQNAVTYIVNFASHEITAFRSKFHPARAQHNARKHIEKDRIATVRWDRLEAAIKHSKFNTGVRVQARLIDEKTGLEEKQTTKITLRPFFVKRIRPYIEDAPFEAGRNPKIRFY